MDSRLEAFYHVCRKKLLDELRQRYQYEYLGDGTKGEDGLGFGEGGFTTKELSVLR